MTLRTNFYVEPTSRENRTKTMIERKNNESNRNGVGHNNSTQLANSTMAVAGSTFRRPRGRVGHGVVEVIVEAQGAAFWRTGSSTASPAERVRRHRRRFRADTANPVHWWRRRAFRGSRPSAVTSEGRGERRPIADGRQVAFGGRLRWSLRRPPRSVKVVKGRKISTVPANSGTF